jgi:hypothetical protein
MTTAEQTRLKNAAKNGSNDNGNQPAAAKHPNKHIEAIANRTSDEFIEVAASLTRAKIAEKLRDGTFTAAVFAVPESEENFIYTLPYGSPVNVLSGALEQ